MSWCRWLDGLRADGVGTITGNTGDGGRFALGVRTAVLDVLAGIGEDDIDTLDSRASWGSGDIGDERRRVVWSRETGSAVRDGDHCAVLV